MDGEDKVNEEEARQIIISPVITEKGAMLQGENNQYFFRIDCHSNKIQIKQAIEKLFEVKVTGVRTMRVRGKKRRSGPIIGYRPNWKKAIVTLKEGDQIDLS